MTAAAVTTYTTELSRSLGYLANWHPLTPIRVGTIGTFRDDHLFEPISDLSFFGVGGTTVRSPVESGTLSYSSKGVTQFSVVSGFTPAPINAGGVQVDATAKFDITFNREHAIVFRASGLVSERVSDEISLVTALTSVLKDGRIWQPEWCVVTEVLTAASTTVLISNSQSSKVEIGVTASVNAGSIDLLDASFAPKVVGQSDMNTIIVNDQKSTPLFTVKRVKTKFWSGQKVLQAMLDSGEVDLADDLLEVKSTY